jgi:hypothetical protein
MLERNSIAAIQYSSFENSLNNPLIPSPILIVMRKISRLVKLPYLDLKSIYLRLRRTSLNFFASDQPGTF